MNCGIPVFSNSVTLNALYYLIILQFSDKTSNKGYSFERFYMII